MIISASRRTDIPAFYSDWLINRLNAGYCLVKNPYNPLQVKRVSLLPQDVDGIVLWTKNIAPLLPKLPQLQCFSYYVQHTITPYHSDIESGLADKKNVIIPAFRETASLIGAERIIWRYDPIVISPRYNYNYHITAFPKLCNLLSGSTKKCVISFVIAYKSIAKNLTQIGYIEPQISDKIRLIQNFLTIANHYGISLHACCELSELYEIGVSPISCVNGDMFGVNAMKDKNQREGCNCCVSVDIGAYNSCMNGCQYCYANHNNIKVGQNYMLHDVNSEFLIG
jgi:hypothetical protein